MSQLKKWKSVIPDEGSVLNAPFISYNSYHLFVTDISLAEILSPCNVCQFTIFFYRRPIVQLASEAGFI
jgi:hypothetical protein